MQHRAKDYERRYTTVKKQVWSMYNKESETFNMPMFFDSDNIAIGEFRRSVRDSYIKGELTRDCIMEREFIKLGEFDTEFGSFTEFTTVEDYPFSRFVQDLIEKEEVDG